VAASTACGWPCPTKYLTEWGEGREAYDSPDAVAGLAGLTPATKESGKPSLRAFPLGMKTHFREAVTTFAGNSRHTSLCAASI
jgi:hypothetical protein